MRRGPAVSGSYQNSRWAGFTVSHERRDHGAHSPDESMSQLLHEVVDFIPVVQHASRPTGQRGIPSAPCAMFLLSLRSMYRSNLSTEFIHHPNLVYIWKLSIRRKNFEEFLQLHLPFSPTPLLHQTLTVKQTNKERQTDTEK